jgi:hypothetical protein
VGPKRSKRLKFFPELLVSPYRLTIPNIMKIKVLFMEEGVPLPPPECTE